MPERVLPGLGLTGYWDLGQSGWKTGADENWRKLSALAQLSVKSRLAAVPVSPTNGDIHILTAAPNAQTVALRDNGAWVHLTPIEGWTAWVQDENAHYTFDGTSWVSITQKNVSLSAFAGSTLDADEVIFVHMAGSAFRLPSGATGSLAASQVAAAGATSISIIKVTGGTPTTVGSISFAAAATVGTFTVAANVDFAIGDMLVLKAPASPDANLADIAISLKGSLL